MFYSFTEKDDKGKTPNKAARAYHLALKCTETWFSTCFDAAIDPNIPNRNPVYAGTRMCDTGNSVDVRIKFAVYLESYG
ncbi:MAG: hypothetical protein LBE18_00800, partial [Planctomycetaceae bacterium]|nr:hypothetical protein [Planctomycetaceae bacterium]